uniref:Recombinase n=1 Tax=Aquisalinus luteolus TaxID=1566827 RepID=A0A8J3A486_9PROT|nr:hypothetical protein GCM10011355_30450 [Aquisalinus luteolus]
MMQPAPKNAAEQKALIYCRVSHVKQRTQGHGLDSQEHRCRLYAEQQGYEVEAVFPDDRSGGGDFMKRPGMVALLNYLETHPQHDYVVIFDDLKRFARDTIFHFMLRHRLAEYNASVECLNFKFEDTPEGEFVETVFAAQGQLERKQNQRQTIQKMRARLENGYWVFSAPIGYRYEKTAGQGKLLVRDEPLASIVKEGLKGFGSGRFQTQAEVKRFFESYAAFPRDKYGEVRNQRVTEILTRSVYAGYVQSTKWNISLRKGHHEPLIDYETFTAIQYRLQEKAKVPTRRDLNEDFPLRGFILCGDCERPLTANWSKSKTGDRHAYYLCYNKDCVSHRKSIRRDKLEGDFVDVLHALQPTEHHGRVIRTVFKSMWDYQLHRSAQLADSIKAEITKLDGQIDTLVNRIVEATSASVTAAYEKRIAAMESRKTELSEKAARTGQPTRPYEELFQLALDFLSNPWNLWSSGNLKDRRMVLKLTFSERLAYHRELGFSNPKTSLPFRVLEEICMDRSKMAHRGGFEPPTPRFVVWCSIQLSYRCGPVDCPEDCDRERG